MKSVHPRLRQTSSRTGSTDLSGEEKARDQAVISFINSPNTKIFPQDILNNIAETYNLRVIRRLRSMPMVIVEMNSSSIDELNNKLEEQYHGSVVAEISGRVTITPSSSSRSI